MIDCVYYNNDIRCYSDGRVERFFKKRNWFLVENCLKEGYAILYVDGKNIYVHRLIAFCFLGLEKIDGKDRKVVIDHINHNKSDNNITNLRVTTQQKNCFNRKCKGYTKNGKKFRATIFVNNKAINLGSYINEQDAANAYKKGKEKYHII